jgi:hypothetical protein
VCVWFLLRKRVDQGIRRFHACSFLSSFFFIKDPQLNKGFSFIHLQQKDVIFRILHDFVVNWSFSVVVHRCHSGLPTTKRNTRRGGKIKMWVYELKNKWRTFWNNKICFYHYVPCSRLLSAKHPCVSATAIVSKRETWEGRLYHKDSGRRLSQAACVPVTK